MRQRSENVETAFQGIGLDGSNRMASGKCRGALTYPHGGHSLMLYRHLYVKIRNGQPRKPVPQS